MNKLPKRLEAVTLALAVGYVLLFLFVAFSRISYPYELEWMEGSSLIQLQRLVYGEQFFSVPSIKFIPFIYPPIYYLLTYYASLVLDVSFVAIRIVSVLATVGTFGLIAHAILQEGGSRKGALLGVGLYAALFAKSGFWYDVGRVDALFVFFLLGGAIACVKGNRLGLFFAVCLFLAAIFTKQTAVLAILPLLLFAVVKHKAKALWLIVPFGAVIFAIYQLGYLAPDTRAFYYMYTLPAEHEFSFSLRAIASFLLRDVTLAIGFALLLIALSVWQLRRRSSFWLNVLAIVVAFGALTFAGRLNPGSFNNVNMPLYAAVAVALGLAVSKWEKRPLLLHTLLLLQFAMLLYNPFPQIPTEADRAQNDAFVAMLAEEERNVFIPFHPYLGLKAGKQTFAHQQAICEIGGCYGGNGMPEWAIVKAEYESWVENKQFSLIVLDRPWLNEDLASFYEEVTLPTIPKPVTGWQIQPTLFYRPVE